jgi:hypothetical protein
MTATGPFMLVPQAEWDELQRQLRYLRRVTDSNTADNGRHAAETFMSGFDPSRADEWGHVSYCLNYAMAARKADAL